jgi:hypothetical protein
MAKAKSGQATREDGLGLLPAADVAWLKERKLKATAMQVGREIHVIITDYQVPSGYNHDKVDLLIRLPDQWPDGKPDMFWVEPHLAIKATGAAPRQTGTRYTAHGRSWQRWSRHIQDGWRPGVDGLENFIAMIGNELDVEPGR